MFTEILSDMQSMFMTTLGYIPDGWAEYEKIKYESRKDGFRAEMTEREKIDLEKAYNAVRNAKIPQEVEWEARRYFADDEKKSTRK